MKEYKDKLLDLFGKFGEINVHDLDDNVYIFDCSLKKITKSKVVSSLGSIKFLLIEYGTGKCLIVCFSVYTKKNENDLLIVNDVNKAIEFGKFIVDEDGDINWEYSFDLTCISSDDIKRILSDSIKGIELFAVLSIKNDREEKLKNEKIT